MVGDMTIYRCCKGIL